jgi:dTDP-glucose 4,6-dehydratase
VRLLVTGGAGFMGSDFVRLLFERGGVAVTVLDALTYAGNLENLRSVEGLLGYRFIHGDICESDVVAKALNGCDAVVHFAAESHVDRSIAGDAPFIRTNVEGTRTLLSQARSAGIGRFIHISTDEVYGELPWRDPELEPSPTALLRFHRSGEPPFFTEESPIAPRSPYSASKAGAEHLAFAYFHTHDLPVVVTRSSNNYGPGQHREKMIPVMIQQALDGRRLPVYGDGLNVRDWLFVRDHSRGVLAALEDGVPGEVYNLGGLSERTNLQVVRTILSEVGMGEDLIEFVNDRPGHDRRYAIDPSKAKRDLGWRAEVSFGEGIRETIRWYGQEEGKGA